MSLQTFYCIFFFVDDGYFFIIFSGIFFSPLALATFTFRFTSWFLEVGHMYNDQPMQCLYVKQSVRIETSM